jgi:repressor LexA
MRTLPDDLTNKQKDIFNFIKSFSVENGYPPSNIEIRDHFKFSSVNSVTSQLTSMKRKGFITIAFKVSRGIKIIKDIGKCS